MRTIRDNLNHRILLADGSVARHLKTQDRDVARDYLGQPDLAEALNISRIDAVRAAHVASLEAGADVVRTNTLRASPLSLAAHDMAEEAFILNYNAAQAAAEAVDSVPGRGRRRFVLGVVRDEGWDAGPADVEAAVDTQVQGLIAGGADAILIDVLPGVGRIQAMLTGAARARAALDSSSQIFLQLSQDGPNFGARTLERADGLVRYRPGDLHKRGWIDQLVKEARVNLIGGGRTVEETAKLDRALRARAEDNFRPVLSWVREQAPVDDFEPASSWQSFPESETAAARTAETV